MASAPPAGWCFSSDFFPPKGKEGKLPSMGCPVPLPPQGKAPFRGSSPDVAIGNLISRRAFRSIRDLNRRGLQPLVSVDSFTALFAATGGEPITHLLNPPSEPPL